MKILPKDVTELEMTFGRIDGLLPAWKDIPDEFKEGRTAWENLVNQIFSNVININLPFLVPKPEIDKTQAINHITTCLRSFEPKYGHKVSGCAYLFSLWFEPFTPSELRDAQNEWLSQWFVSVLYENRAQTSEPKETP